MGKYNLDPSKLGSLDLTPNQLGAQAYRRSGSFVDWAPAGSIAEAMTSVPQWSNLVTNFATQPMLSDVDIGAGLESARIGGLEGSRDAYSAWQEGITPERIQSMWPTDKLSDLVGLGVSGLQSIPSALTPESTMQALPEDRRILEQYQKDYALPLEAAQQPSAIPGLSRGEAKGLFESGFQALPSAAMAVLTRRMPMGARLPSTLAPFAAPVWAQSYERAVTEGASPLEASKQAKLHTIFEVGPELIPFGIFLKPGLPLITKILASIPAEYISEALTEVGYIGEEFYKGDLSWEDPNIESMLLERINRAGKLGAYMGPMMGTSIAGAEAVAQQTADVVSPRATEADMLAELEQQTATLPGQQTIAADLPQYIEALEGQETGSQVLQDTLNQAREEQASRETGLPARNNFLGMNIGDTSVFNLQDIYDVVSEGGTKRPSKRQVKQHVEDLVFEEVVFHGGVRRFATANQDKLDAKSFETLDRFYSAYRKQNEIAFQSWVNNPANALYSTSETEQEEEFAQDHMRGLQKQKFRNIFRRIANKIIGAEDTVFGLRDRDIINLLDRVQESMKVRKEMESAAAVDEASAAASKKGFDPSRRKFLKQAGGAIAGAVVDPSIILEPATPTPPIAPPGFAGGIMRPGIAPEYESAMRAAEMASPSGLVSDVASEAFDDFDYEAAAREDQALADQLEAYEAEQPEREKVPQKWRELETIELQALMEENRAKGNAIWVAQNKELESRDLEPISQLTTEERVTLEEAGEADALILSLDNIYSTFDSDYSVADAIVDGALDKLVRMEAQNSNFTRQELWDGVNARQEALESMETESDRREAARAAKRRMDMSDAEVLNRDVRNEATKKYRKAINASDIPDEEKNVRSALLKDLLRPWGAEGMNRDLTPGDKDTFRRYAQMIVDGELDAVIEFVQPFLDQITEKKAPSKTKTAKRDYYAGYKGVSASELAEYRERGKTHPMERKMTYPFADEEIDRLEAGGEITANEAENRRRVSRELRSALQGKLPQTVKRKLTEIVYGIEDYADITPWTDKYTATEVEGMEERAEVAQAEARRTRYEKTKLTKTQEAEILEESITTEERAALAEMEGNEQFDNLKTRNDRLLFLRKPSSMSVAEREELDAFLSDVKGFDQTKYKEQRAKKVEEDIEASGVKVTRIPAVDTEAQRKDIAKMWKEENRFRQMDPTVMEQSIEDTSIDALDAESLDVATITGESVGRAQKRRRSSDYFTKLLMNATSQSERDSIASMKRAHDEIEALLEEHEGKEMPAVLYNRIESLINRYESGASQAVRVERGALGARFRDNIKKMKGRQAPKIAAWKRLLEENQITFTKTGHSTDFLRKSEEEKKNILLKWFEFEDGQWGELPDSLKRTIYQSMPETFGKWDNTLVRTFNTKGRMRLQQLRYLTGLGWSIEHKAEFSDPIIQRDLIPYLRGELNNTESAALMVLLNDLSNLSLMPEFLNTFKKNIKNHAQMAIVNDWFQILNDQLEGSTDFMESHQKALDEFIKKYKDSALINIPELKPQTDKVDKDILEFINAEYGELETLAYQNALISGDLLVYKGMAALAADQVANASKKASGTSKDYSEHFSDQFWYRFTSYLWGKPVQAIRDFNKFGRLSTDQGTIEAADKIADLIQRAHSWETRAKGEVLGPDLIQDISMRTGEFYSELFRVFAKVTNIVGAINATNNKQLVDALVGRSTRIKDPKVEAAAKELRQLIEKVYAYAKAETKGLQKLTNESPLDLRGHGDSLLPRVWNIEFLATRKGKAKLLRALSEAFSEPGKTTPIFEGAGITVEDMYNVIINSGGFVQGEWTNLKADQTRTEADIQRDLRVQEYLDSLETENLIDEGLVLDDLQAVIPRFIQKAIERTEYSKRFGKNDKRMRELIKEGIDQIREHNKKVYKMKKGEERLPHIDEKRFEQAAWDMARILRNKYGYDLANMATRTWLQRAQNVEVVAKLPLVTLASMPEFFTPMLRGDVSPHHWFMDLMAGMAWAGYKGMNGMSKLLLNKHLPAMLKRSKDIEGLGIISDVQLLRELGIADIQAMGDLVSTRYANPNFARGGLRAGAGGTVAGKIPKNIRAVFNMQTYMQATMLTTMTEMQQLMALRHFQRFASKRVKYLKDLGSGKLSPRQKRLSQQYRRDLLDFGITESIDLDTAAGEAAFNVGALRFVDQVITRPNDATTAKAFKNPLLSPVLLFKRFITTYGNTLLVAVGNDFAHSPNNIEKAKTVGQTLAVASMMYGAVMFAEIIRAALKGDLDEDDFKALPDDFRVFMRRLDRTGLLTAPGTLGINLAFPYKRGWWDTAEARITGEALGPIGGDVFALGDALIENKEKTWERLLKQLVPTTKIIKNFDLDFDFDLFESKAKGKTFSDRSW